MEVKQIGMVGLLILLLATPLSFAYGGMMGGYAQGTRGNSWVSQMEQWMIGNSGNSFVNTMEQMHDWMFGNESAQGYGQVNGSQRYGPGMMGYWENGTYPNDAQAGGYFRRGC